MLKLAYPISAPDVLFTFMGFPYSGLKKISSLGYDGIELFVCDPDCVSPKELQRAGLKVAAIGTTHVLKQDKISLISSGEVAIKRFRKIIQLAAELHCCVSIGKSRGSIKGIKNGLELLADALSALCSYACGLGVDLVIEPQNPEQIDNINSISDAAALIDAIGKKNLLIHADTLHMGITEASAVKSIIKYRRMLGFVHLAGPGRGIPSDPEIIKALVDVGYDGFCSMEVAQSPDNASAAIACLESVRSMEAACLNIQ